MGLFGRRAKKAGRKPSVDRSHLEEFARTRRGVEAYVEPRTTVTEPTVVLVAYDGEWTRRRVPSPEVAFGWAQKLGVPCYDANLVGYPRRMRDWTARRKAEGRPTATDEDPEE